MNIKEGAIEIACYVKSQDTRISTYKVEEQSRDLDMLYNRLPISRFYRDLAALETRIRFPDIRRHDPVVDAIVRTKDLTEDQREKLVPVELLRAEEEYYNNWHRVGREPWPGFFDLWKTSLDWRKLMLN